jgi:hypothetical protein
MGNTGTNTGVTKWGTAFSSLRRTRHKRRTQRLRHSFVYFIQADNGMVKIGYAGNPVLRLRTMQSGSPLALRLLVYARGDSVAEERLHAAFDSCRHTGEWFRPDAALMAYIADLKAAVGWTEFSLS